MIMYRIEMIDKDQYKHIYELKNYDKAMYYYEKMWLSNVDIISIKLIEQADKHTKIIKKVNGVFNNE
jgi:hypothetical protein